MTDIPLFPLSTTLMPHGLMALQIFEQRYLDLVSHCLKTGTGFGVVWMRRGVEVAGEGINSPDLGDYGTYGRIVDFDQYIYPRTYPYIGFGNLRYFKLEKQSD